MSKMMVAKSFANAERIGEPFEKNGKLYTKIKEKCDRCNGRGDYWWGAMINGRPQFSGTCYQCNGAKYFIKEVRLYTEEEYARMEAANERARQKRAEALEAKMKAEYAQKKEEWIQKNGFNAEGVTYIYAGNDSYSIKEQLKEDNFIFDSILLWHKATKDEKYAEKLIEISLDDIVEFSAWGQGHFKPEAKSIITNKLEPKVDYSSSEYIGEVGKKVEKLKVKLIRKGSFEGRYGLSHIYSFLTDEGNVLSWFSTVIIPFEVDDYLYITGTIKSHNEYKDVKTTYLTRCKTKEV